MTAGRTRSLLRRLGSSGENADVAWDLGRAPVTVVARADARVRLTFRRSTGDWATDAVCFPDFGMLFSLEPFTGTPIDLDPREPGAYRFHAPHGDLEGWLIVAP